MNNIQLILAVLEGKELTSKEIKKSIADTFFDGELNTAQNSTVKSQLTRMTYLGLIERKQKNNLYIYRAVNAPNIVEVKNKRKKMSRNYKWQVGCYYNGQLVSSRNFDSIKMEQKYIENCKKISPDCTFEKFDKPYTIEKASWKTQKVIKLNKEKYTPHPIKRTRIENDINWFGEMPVYRAEKIVKETFGTTNYRNLTRNQITELYNKYGTTIR